MLASQWMNFIHLHGMSFWGVELELWLFFNYITTNGKCHVIDKGHGILEFWLLFNYIITNGTLTRVTWTFMVHHQTKLFDVCHVYGLKILNLLIYWRCQHMISCHVDTYVTHLHDTWHLAFCGSSNICKVEPK
jgi:hypothetical protein